MRGEGDRDKCKSTGSSGLSSRYSYLGASCCSLSFTGSLDKASNADRLEAFFRKAAKQKPDVIVAPEGVLEGYVITDVTWHRERADAFHDMAEPLDGPYIRRFRKLARSLRTCLCFGFAERI